VVRTVLLLTASNVFMTFAWYAHLRNLSDRPWYIAALVSWGIALFEYLLQVPANRIGFETLSLAQLKIIQEVITLGVFVPFALLYMRQPVNWNFVWAGLLPARRGLLRVQVMHAELSAIEQEFESALVRLHELRTKVPPDVWKRRPSARTLVARRVRGASQSLVGIDGAAGAGGNRDGAAPRRVGAGAIPA
jgi:uncharacterized protein (DUF486 family)